MWAGYLAAAPLGRSRVRQPAVSKALRVVDHPENALMPVSFRPMSNFWIWLVPS